MSKIVIVAELAATAAVAALGYYAYKNADKLGASLGGAIGGVAKKFADAVSAGAEAASKGVGQALSTVSPTNPNNVFSKAATAVYQGASGNDVDSLGTAIANVFPSAAEREVNRQLAKKNDPGTRAVLPQTGGASGSWGDGPTDTILNPPPVTDPRFDGFGGSPWLGVGA